MDWEKTVGDAFSETDANLSSRISGLCKLNGDTIDALAPKQIDKENLLMVLSTVKDATLSNEKKAEAIKAINGSVDLLIDLVGKLV
jgi:hypothetical protein